MKEQTSEVIVSRGALQMALNYLATCPWKDVQPFIGDIIQAKDYHPPEAALVAPEGDE